MLDLKLIIFLTVCVVLWFETCIIPALSIHSKVHFNQVLCKYLAKWQYRVLRHIMMRKERLAGFIKNAVKPLVPLSLTKRASFVACVEIRATISLNTANYCFDLVFAPQFLRITL